MTTERIKELRELCDKVTPGPWYEYANQGHVFSIQTLNGSGGCILPRSGYEWIRVDDAKFIAASRTAIPELLDEIERLQRELSMHGTP